MRYLKYKSRGKAVFELEEMLVDLGYDVKISSYFGKDTHAAIIDFQKRNGLAVDGIVGPNTMRRLKESESESISFNDKSLSEEDLINFATQYKLELAVVKAVSEVESRGKGYLKHGRPIILFEGHVFWRELVKRGVDPKEFAESRLKNVLYKTWTKNHYVGGSGEYARLEKAAGMSDLNAVHDAAYASASWGSFQIMGFHFKRLGYASVDHFVSEMYEHEREQLKAFGKFIEITTFSGKKLIDWLREKNWSKFAHGYNGAGYKKNKYDEKLANAYSRNK